MYYIIIKTYLQLYFLDLQTVHIHDFQLAGTLRSAAFLQMVVSTFSLKNRKLRNLIGDAHSVVIYFVAVLAVLVIDLLYFLIICTCKSYKNYYIQVCSYK